MKEKDESDEEILDTLIRREAEGAAKKLGVSQAEAENAIRQNGMRASSNPPGRSLPPFRRVNVLRRVRSVDSA